MLHQKDVTLGFSQRGKPTDNAFVKSFNGRLRKECLNAYRFLSIINARAKTETWRLQYKKSRRHTSRGWITPVEYPAAVIANATE